MSLSPQYADSTPGGPSALSVALWIHSVPLHEFHAGQGHLIAERLELPHVCVSNAERIAAGEVELFLQPGRHERRRDGVWESRDKDIYAQQLAAEGLMGRLLSTDDRVIKMLTCRALELLKLEES